MTATTRAPSRTPARPAQQVPGWDRILGGLSAKAVVWIVLIGWALFSVLPVVWLLLSVSKTETELSTLSPFAFGSWGNIADSWRQLYAFQDGIFLTWIKNSLILTVSSTVLALIVTVPAGYALGTLDFPGRRTVLVVSLGMMLLPASSLALPLFLEMNALRLVGSLWAVILPLTVYPFGLYVAFIYFSTSVSHELYDAARVDGCTETQVFLHVALPLSKPITGLIAFFAFIRCWNEFLLPVIMLCSDGYPLPVGLNVLASLTSELTSSNPGQAVHAPALLLGTIITMIPVVVGILVAQKIVIQGAGALGGALRE